MAMGIRIFIFSGLVISKNWGIFPQKLAKLVQFDTRKAIFSKFFPISSVKKNHTHIHYHSLTMFPISFPSPKKIIP
jgi:hypothetical protein